MKRDFAYTVFLFTAIFFQGIGHADEVKACSSVLPYLCQNPNCSDNKAVTKLCPGTVSFAEAGTECMKPLIPLVRCTLSTQDPPSAKVDAGPSVWYITYKEGKYEVIKSAEDLRKLFAPVSDPKTALGLALLQTHDFPLFVPPFPSLNNGWCSTQADFGTWVNRIAAESKVDKTDTGFNVQLFTIAREPGYDQLLPRTFSLDTAGTITQTSLGKSPMWYCGKPGKKKK